MMKVAGVIQVRLASERCTRKNLRPFGNTNLTTLALSKFVKSKEISNLYLAAYEGELLECAKRFKDVKIIKRNKESAYGEDFATVLNYITEIEEEFIININSCCPFFTVETLDKAVKFFKEHNHSSMIAVYPTYGWYFNEGGLLINDDENAIKANSKMLKPIYKHSCAFVLFDKARALKEQKYWSFKKDDPHLFVIDEEEAFDIDTELDFKIAEVLYELSSK